MSGSCVFDGCVKPAYVKGLCRGHYSQKYAGKPLTKITRHSGRTIAERIEAFTQRTPGCWNWTGALDDGYPMLGGRRAAPEIWRIATGSYPAPGLWLLHRCDNPPCVRPDHLFLGTHEDNMRDMAEKGRSLRGVSHPRAILSESIVVEMRGLCAAGTSFVDVAARFGLGASTARAAIRGRTWRHVPGAVAV